MTYILTIEKDSSFDDGTPIGNIKKQKAFNDFTVFQNEDKGLFFIDRNGKQYLNDMMTEIDFNKVQDAILMFMFSKDKANQTTKVEINL